MTRVASAANASPMSLYRHISDREDLLESMLEELLRRLQIELEPGASWQEDVQSWMTSVREHFLKHPQILSLIDFEPGSFISPSWLRTGGELIGPLKSAGFSGPKLPRALYWVSRVTLGTLLQEIAAPVADAAAVAGGVGRLEGDDALRWMEVLPALTQMDDDEFFEMTRREVVRTLEALLLE